MSLIFSRQCEYALQAVSYLALKPAGEMTSIKELTKRLDIPYHFLGKILQDLSRKGLLTSMKGPTGGFALGMPSDEITLLHIVEAVDGVDFSKQCIMGFPECSGKNPCAIHEKWAGLRDSFHQMLVGKNIAEIAREMKKPMFHHKKK
jgi:Rrf2 family transcriptional regulator, iron-sulfur cluster assembly transcription factor